MSNLTGRDAIEEIYRLWCTGDENAVSLLMENLSDNIRWCSLSNGCEGAKFSRERNGADQILGYFEDLVEEWDMIHFTVDQFVGEGDTLVMLGHCGWKHKQTGNTVESPKIDVWTLHNDKVVEFKEYYDTAKVMQAALSS